jgi:lipid A ethanolaminephosphotransferase
MFSLLGKDDYSPQKADNQSNVLDILHKAGVKVFWLDNNSSCKGVCHEIQENVIPPTHQIFVYQYRILNYQA